MNKRSIDNVFTLLAVLGYLGFLVLLTTHKQTSEQMKTYTEKATNNIGGGFGSSEKYVKLDSLIC
jgi:hypothetical protein